MICLFHVLKTFKREITPGKLGGTVAEKQLVLEIIQKMPYARTSEAVAEPGGGQFGATAPPNLCGVPLNGTHLL